MIRRRATPVAGVVSTFDLPPPNANAAGAELNSVLTGLATSMRAIIHERGGAMGKLIYSALASLDGYVADDRRQVGLGRAGRGGSRLRERARATGRHLSLRTRDVRGDDRLGDLDLADEPAVIQDFAEIWRAADKIVFSRTLDSVSSARTRLEREFDPEAVRRLKEKAGSRPRRRRSRSRRPGDRGRARRRVPPVPRAGDRGRRQADAPRTMSASISSCATSAGSTAASSSSATPLGNHRAAGYPGGRREDRLRYARC